MTPDQLVQRMPLALGDLLPERTTKMAEELGDELRLQYVDRVQTFRDIVNCTRYRVVGTIPPTRWTPPINLGRYNHQTLGGLDCSATVALREYDPECIDSWFNVITHFYGKTNEGVMVAMGQETFGASRYGFEDKQPTFIRNPSTTCTDPWDRLEETTFRYPSNRRWTMTTYMDILRNLSPMLNEAADTQKLLITAMCDESLNRDMAASASRLTIPDPSSVTS